MATHRSAMGKSVDMGALMKKNEHVRAVGNAGVNARGDTIDSMGRITRPVTDKVNAAYSKTVGNRSAQPRAPAPQVDAIKPPPPQVEPVSTPIKSDLDLSQLNEIELELEDNAAEDIEVEQIKAAEKKSKK